MTHTAEIVKTIINHNGLCMYMQHKYLHNNIILNMILYLQTIASTYMFIFMTEFEKLPKKINSFSDVVYRHYYIVMKQ